MLLSKSSRQRQSRSGNYLRDATIRDFSGGLNVIDNDLNLNTKYAKVLDNFHGTIDGSNAVRPGTELFADISAYIDKGINLYYFASHLIVVGSNGKIVRINSLGEVVLIFDDDWANGLPGSPNGWDTTSFCSFTEFAGELIICNGINKPLVVNSNLFVTFLQDKATGSNVFTPTARFVRTVGRYLVMAGDLLAPDTIYISSTDTSGVFVGDVAPNDAVNIQLGSRVSIGSSVIKGIGVFRGQLIVAFEEVMLPVKLGVFVSGDHVPTFGDPVESIGSVSHRVLQSIGEDLLFADLTGVSSVGRSLFTNTIKSGKHSELIDPIIQSALERLDTLALEENTFSVYNSQASNYMLFVPNDSVNPTETIAFVLKKIDKLKVFHWSTWSGWNFSAVARSSAKRLYAIKQDQIFILGDEADNINEDQLLTKDYIGDQEMWDDETPFTDQTGFTPISSRETSGVPIKFTWELPWSDSDHRFNTKTSRYLSFDTVGEEEFTAEMFIDNIYKDRTFFGEEFSDGQLFDDGLGWDAYQLDPALSTAFLGGDVKGFGQQEFGKGFGGGLSTHFETLYHWPEKYKIFKLRISGEATKALRFVSITMAYNLGSIRRN